MRYCPHCKQPISKGQLLKRPNKVRKPKPQRFMTTPAPANSLNNKVWSAMRMLPSFTLGELRATTECGRGAVGDFTRALVKAGYVRCLQRNKVGTPGAHAIYKLVRNTGPHAPRLRTSSIFDVNTREEVANVC